MAASQGIKNAPAKTPPQNLEAEKSVLGSLMLDTNAAHLVADILAPDDFYSEKHSNI